MKKIILSVATLSTVVSAVNAQDKSVYFAPEAGANMFKVTNNSYAKYNIGFKAGVNVILKAGENFSIAPGLFYSMKGYKFDETILNVHSKYKVTLGYIELPINLQYDFNFDDGSSFFVFAGPYLGYGVNANNGLKFGSDAGKIKAFDWGFNFGLGYKASFGGFVRAQYQLGMGNMSNVDGVKSKNTGFALSVGYVF